jgi:hypothetical protein
MECSQCHAAMESGDIFCGSCGSPSLAPSRAGARSASAGNGSAGNGPAGNGKWPTAAQTVPRQASAARETAPSGPFFSHTRSRPDGRMTNATRYLCAAAYLDAAYAATVIRELIASVRAVAPSVGIDLGPIIRHCLRARNIQLARDVVLSILLLIGLITDTGQMILLLIVCFLAGFLPGVNWGRRSFRSRAAAVVGVLVLIGGVLLVLTVVNVLGALRQSLGQGLSSPDGTFGATAQPSGSGLHQWVGPALLLAIVATQLIYTYVRSRTLCDELAPGASPRRPRLHGMMVESRIAQVEGAQQGNLVLYSGPNPFIGTGQRTRAWSIAVELRRASGRKPDGHPRRSPDYVAIDPVELHQAIRDRLLRLKDAGLPPNEQLQALTVRDHIVGLGEHRWDSPLIDRSTSVPYSEASPETVQALIRHPQAGVRYYQRVSVCDEGQPVFAGGRKIMDGSDQDISASAFVYAAVEGHMFYLEFVSAVMPPINPRWHIVDRLPKFTPGKFMARVVVDALVSTFQAVIFAPIRAVGAVVDLTREGRSQQEQSAAAQEYLYSNIGARISVRELGAARNFRTYIQQLDAEKYTKLTERLVTDTVLDFLAGQGVDTSAYVSSVMATINNSTTIHGGTFHGPVAFGAEGSAHQSQQPQPAQA